MMGAPSEDIPDLAAMLARETARARTATARIRQAQAEGGADKGEAFTEAEIGWLVALADYLDDRGVDLGDDAVLARSRSLAQAETAAWLAFVRQPAPTVVDLPRKVLAIERRATEVAQDEAEPLHLVEGLAQLRADLLRLSRA